MAALSDDKPLRNPWLDIPLDDYEGHMSQPEIGQAPMLAEELGSAVRDYSPRSVALIGCAGGNGLDRLEGLERIIGIDINPRYIEIARRRYSAQLPGLELYVADVERELPSCVPVDLVFAGLIFEYVDVSQTMKALRTLCTVGGTLIVILQCAQSQSPAVSQSAYQSLQSLKSVMQLRNETDLKACAESAGFSPTSTRILTLPSGKSFAVMVFSAR